MTRKEMAGGGVKEKAYTHVNMVHGKQEPQPYYSGAVCAASGTEREVDLRWPSCLHPKKGVPGRVPVKVRLSEEKATQTKSSSGLLIADRQH